ncbi:MAG: hypothetical protein WAT66_02425 [Actinomycetota bacterium]
MKRCATRTGTLVASLLLVLGFGATPALAQVPPIPPLPQPTLPPEAQPVLEVISPTVYPQCGSATLLVFLGSANLPPQIAPQIRSAAGPVFVVCGTVPRPPQQYTCLLDVQQQEALSTVFAQAGVPPPLFIHPEGDLVEQTILVVDLLPPPASDSEILTTLPQLLVCSTQSGTGPVPRDNSNTPRGALDPPAYNPPAAGLVPVPGVLYPAPPIQPPSVLALDGPPQKKLGAAAGDLRRRLGTMLGVALLLLSILYWSDGFGVVRLRSSLAARRWRT